MPIYNWNQNKNPKFAQHKQAKGKEKQRANWRDQINFTKKYDGYRQKFKEMSSKYAKFKEGYLGCISVTTHTIQLSRKTAL